MRNSPPPVAGVDDELAADELGGDKVVALGEGEAVGVQVAADPEGDDDDAAGAGCLRALA